MDLVLDVVVELDGSWRLKDEDELVIFAARGVVEPELERRVRTEADAIVAKLERREPPFDGSFEDWRPAADWPDLVLPKGWEHACR
jgi:predicted RNA-binding protein associated with RNAse of E/G family